MSNPMSIPEHVESTKVFDALTAAQKAMVEVAKPLVSYKPVMKRLDLAMTALESANLWLSAALMAYGEMQSAIDKAAPEQMNVAQG